MVTTLQDISTHAAQPQGAQYRYDQLNRIKEMQVWQNMDVVNNQWQSGSALSDYRTSYRYDANGNILNLNRNGHNSVNLAMDSLSYHYIAGTNRLAYVDDAVASGNYSVDIDDQAVGNYAYDATGNLIKDVAEEIDSIVWTAYGKVLRVVRSSVSSKPDLHFAYGPDGNRLSKKAIYGNDSTVWTFYVRDAQGNTMATYKHKESSGVLHLTDHVMYGSSRLGSHERKHVELLGAGSSPITARAGIFGLERGDKRYELSNHLGNVLAVVSDRRAKASCADTLVSGYWGDVVSTNDYYPFGSPKPGRSFGLGNYEYGYNGQRMDNEIAGNGNHYNYGDRDYDPKLGRWWSLDPLKNVYIGVSPYVFAGNSTIILSDPDGNILRDKDGNIIVTSTGTYTGLNYSLAGSATKNADGTSTADVIARNYEVVTIYADDGTPVEALRLVEAHVSTGTFDSKGNLISVTGNKAVDDSKFDATADCHGYTFASNILWINNDQVDIILEHDDYTRGVGEKEAEVVIFKDKGKIIHSGRRNADGTYTNNAGYSTTESGVTLEGASRGLTDVSVSGNVEFAKKNTPDRQVDISSGTVSGGLRWVTKGAVTKAVETTTPSSGSSTGSTGGTALPALDFQPHVAPANATYVAPPVILPTPEKK